MAGKKTLNLTGTSGETYNLDEMKSGHRKNSEEKLIVHVHKYKADENPNPENPVIGQIWLSKRVDD